MADESSTDPRLCLLLSHSLFAIFLLGSEPEDADSPGPPGGDVPASYDDAAVADNADAVGDAATAS
jgi:hypothetical protein